ncbi:MAG: hypothetical protein ACFFCS_15180 [Candidatus Hodarchaeota archaeon]
MKKTSRLLFMVFFVMLTCMIVWPIKASAVTETVYPSTFQTIGGANIGVDNQPSFFSEKDDDKHVAYTSEASGDGHYHETFAISSKSDFKEYFRLVPDYNWRFPVSEEDEKLDADDVVHKDVMRFEDDYSSGTNYLYYSSNQWMYLKERINESSVEQTGYFEFYFLSESTDGSFTIIFGDYGYRMTESKYNSEDAGFGLQFGIAPGLGNQSNSSFFCANRWTDTPIKINNTEYEPNKWYHVHMAFDLNNSWEIKINNNTAFNSTDWNATVPIEVTKFDYITMHTQTKFSYSDAKTHVFYIDALGLSYNITAHNDNSVMDFNEDYEDWQDPNSINNWNDHVVNASIELYFRFSLGDLATRSGKLIIKAYFTVPVDPSKMKLYNWNKKVYDIHMDPYNPYLDTWIEEIPIAQEIENGINTSTYANDDGKLTLKIDTQSGDYFEFRVDFIAVEYEIILISEIMLIVIPIIGVIVLIIIYRISRKGPKSSRGRRSSSSRR